MAENRAPKAPAREFGDRGMKQRRSRRKVCAFCADKVEMIDGYDNGDTNGDIVNIIYKGDHYQVMVRTDDEEDFITITDYTWNEGDQVSIKVQPQDIKLTLKGEIAKYEVE